MTKNDFNLIAPLYDRMVSLTFGKRLIQAQAHFLHRIKADDRVLILGGGTGQILSLLPDCLITFVDQSAQMIKRARAHSEKAEFIVSDYLNFQPDQRFDWIICPCFLDCFSLDNLNEILTKIHSQLDAGGHLIVTDFQVNKRVWLTRMMLYFFRLVANLEARTLLPLEEIITQSGFNPVAGQSFSGEYLFSTIFKKT